MEDRLFRGKTYPKEQGVAFNNIWVEGDLVVSRGKYYIHPRANAFQVEKELSKLVVMHEVIPETVGQCIGLPDKNGKKIFKGDIVVTRFPSGEICAIGDVQFDYGVFGAEWIHHKKSRSMVGGWGQLHNLRRFDDDIINHIEVIGNIHDNPELLEAQV